jgi:hypothetical protein
MIQMIILKEYQNKSGLEGYVEAIEERKLHRVIDLIQLDLQYINEEILELVEMSAEFVVQQVIHSLIQNATQKRPSRKFNMNILFKILSDFYKIYLKKHNQDGDENSFKSFGLVSMAYLINWLKPFGVSIAISERKILFDVENFNYLYSKKSNRFK